MAYVMFLIVFLAAILTSFTKASLAPALFILGDSSVDSGTNDFLPTFARADHPPYGRDFDTHLPTGRFSNGRTPVDYLGLPFVPNYLELDGTVESMKNGVNYASAGAGIISGSGKELGERIAFLQQIQQFTDTYQNLLTNTGDNATTKFLSNSIFYISIGINDYIHNYLHNASGVESRFLPWNFNRLLASTVVNEIKNLYRMQVRNVVVMGLPPIGCAPHLLWLYFSENGTCIQDINNMVTEYSYELRYMIHNLIGELPDLNIIFCDYMEGALDIIDNHDRYGFTNTTAACCGLGEYNGWLPCLFPGMACENASSYIWWDQYHPTDRVNSILADDIWDGQHTRMCWPYDMKGMLSRKKNAQADP